MDRVSCHICGTSYEGEVCPACGTARAHSDPVESTLEEQWILKLKDEPEDKPKARSLAETKVQEKTKDKPKAKPNAAFSGPNTGSIARAIRRFFWAMLLITVCICLLFAHRSQADMEHVAENLKLYVQARTDIVYLWEALEESGKFGGMAQLFENIPQFLEFAGDNFFNALEEVGARWSTH